MCIWPSEYLSLISCNTSTVTSPLSTFNFFLCCCLSADSHNISSLLFLYLALSLHAFHSSPLSVTLTFSSFLSSRNSLFCSVKQSLFFPSLLSLHPSPLSRRCPLRLPLSPLLSYYADTFRWYNLCVAPLCSSSSYLIFHFTLCASEWGNICRSLKIFTLGSKLSVSRIF